jgi:hypothetical protein
MAARAHVTQDVSGGLRSAPGHVFVAVSVTLLEYPYR